jgi:tetratricopeptide (TPR) repeat protein
MPRHSEAKDPYLQSLNILEQMNPIPDDSIVGTLQALSKIYLREGDKSSAESALGRAVEISRRNPVPHPDMPTLLDAYANVLKSLGKFQQAQSLNAEARRTRAAIALTVRVPKPD